VKFRIEVEVYDVVLPSVVDDKGINCDDEIEECFSLDLRTTSKKSKIA